jgi:hypothetical protein
VSADLSASAEPKEARKGGLDLSHVFGFAAWLPDTRNGGKSDKNSHKSCNPEGDNR